VWYTRLPSFNTCFFTDEACFHRSGCISAQKDGRWSGVNLRQVFEVPVHSQKIDVWCAITATHIIGPTFLEYCKFRAVCVCVAFFSHF
jgi:hypothetical protein